MASWNISPDMEQSINILLFGCFGLLTGKVLRTFTYAKLRRFDFYKERRFYTHSRFFEQQQNGLRQQ